MKRNGEIIIYNNYAIQYRSAEKSADLKFCLISGKERKTVESKERSGTDDFVRDDRKKPEILKKVIMSLISIVVMVAGEFIKRDGEEDLKKW